MGNVLGWGAADFYWRTHNIIRFLKLYEYGTWIKINIETTKNYKWKLK